MSKACKRTKYEPQSAYVLSLLKRKGRTTVELQSLSVISPTARIADLRKMGCIIDTQWVDAVVNGRKTRIGRYSYHGTDKEMLLT